jgi:uncharacterized protein
MSSQVVHFELWSKDPEKTGAFYEKTLGWKITAVPQLNYWTADTGGGPGKDGINGGIFKPKDGPGSWPGNICCYAKVERIADALKKVVAAGGKTIVDRTEIPNMGAYAIFLDPDGRAMGLWE